ncbi:50S ribosomal protein L14e [Candidatus Woesearchaeota archaeon]|nr:50S ribosomal protein L14e [Candidatus Woesearchaeota archaeon]
MLMSIGRLCLKTAGRDAGNIAVIIDTLDNNFVVIDGYVRRKRCNIKHLEPLDQILKIDKKASTVEVRKALEAAKIHPKKQQNFIKNRKTKENKSVEEKPIKPSKPLPKKKSKK